MGQVCIDGSMVGDTKGNGKIIIWKGMEFILGKMEGVIKVNIKRTKSMGTEYMLGLMEGDMKDGGTQPSNLA